MAFKAACVQLSASDDVTENTAEAVRLIRQAARTGAQFIATPENTTLIGSDSRSHFLKSSMECDDQSLPKFCSLAAELGVWLAIGSIPIRIEATKIVMAPKMVGFIEWTNTCAGLHLAIGISIAKKTTKWLLLQSRTRLTAAV